MKRFTKIMLVSGVTLVLAAGAIVNYLLAQPAEEISDLTLANIEAMAAADKDVKSNLATCLGIWGKCTLPGGTESKAPAVEINL